ncbi:tRNA lysidine(34) synthetase TilS [Bifidobacterium samirii]|uniref:tRNA(Ile)-lysidine synthase n=1 Tax=Bifidobacterium samirii TaxID=2306974 RepID=A0A430FWW4_9BIFI|nr:tRNA lysidine(34) synthetase TilS [Bifidobacterium samirii]RSX58769.1 tRNA(Ile)-lysidine synthetase [Bifidobacterium samirii]
MAYTARLRTAIGGVRATLATLGIDVQDPRFRTHGEHAPDPDAPLVLVACSGGRDSMALAATARIVCASLGVRCGAVIIDHAMQDGSADVARDAADRCRALGIDPVVVDRIDVPADRRGAEAAARDARYAAIARIAGRLAAACVLLAHTRDDQAETVLIGLLRSGGTDALAGMPAVFARDGVRYARPLLERTTRDDTTGICRDLDVAWWDDPTNGDAADPDAADDDAWRALPLRSRIRQRLIPYLRDFTGGDIAAHLADASRSLRADKAYLDEMADAALERARVDAAGDVLRLSAKRLAAEHPAIRRRVIAHALGAAGIEASARQIEAVERLAADWHGQGAVSFSSGYSAFRQKHVIRVCQDGAHANRRRSRSD